MRATRVALDGTALDAPGLVITELATAGGACPGEPRYATSNPTVTFYGEGFVVAWQERGDPCAPDSYTLHGVPVSLAGDLGAAFVISSEPEVFSPRASPPQAMARPSPPIRISFTAHPTGPSASGSSG